MSVSLKILNEEEIQRIYEATIEVLCRTGTIIEDDYAIELLRQAGAKIDDPYHVHIPENIIEQAISSAPYPVTIYDRLGQVAMELGDNNSYFGAHVDCNEVIDLDTGDRRKMKLEDVERVTLVCDALTNIDFITSLDVIADADPSYADAAVFASTIKNTSKPIAFPFISLETGNMIFEIASAAVGGSKQLLEKPFVIYTDSPVAPLYHPKEPTRKTIFAAQMGLPYLYNPMPQGGLTAPTTMAGVLVITLAELLTGLIITQLVNPGTPYICGGVPSIFDMRDTTFVYGSPELCLMCSALTDIAHHYDLPIFGTAGVTNAKILDTQAANDTAIQTFMAILSGSNMVHDVGLLDVGLLLSLELIVLTDEIVSMVRKVERGIEVTEETLAIDVIDNVGPKGNFIDNEHTLKHYKECWYPRIFDHSSRRIEEKTLYAKERINKYIDEILSQHHPEELPPKVLELISTYKRIWKLKE